MNSFILKSKKKFNNFLYDCLDYKNSKIPITLTCNIHNYKFTITTRSHLGSKFGGCIKCDFDFRYNLFSNQSKKKYGDNFIITKDTYVNTSTKVNIKCQKHDIIFDTNPQKHLTQTDGGCNKCNKNYIDNLINAFYEKSKEKFGSNYDYNKFKYTAPKDKSILKCNNHNIEFEITPTTHLQSIYGGCEKCQYLTKTKEKTKKEYAIKKKLRKQSCILESDEEWKVLNINGFENSYKISNYGKIYSMKNNIYMKLTKNKNGYMQVRLYDKNTKSKIFRIHRLVALLFLNNPNDKKYVDHIDRVRNNNHFKNLRWATHKENMENKSKYEIKRIHKPKFDVNESFEQIGIINDYNFSDYLISKIGVIKNKYSKILSPYLNDGYLSISIQNKSMRSHRLIAYVYLKKPANFDDGYAVNHIDENRLNNSLENLEWCTKEENTKKYFQKHKVTENKKTIKIIVQIDKKTNKIINEYSSYVQACKKLNKPLTSTGNISYCCKGYRKSAFGYLWKFK